MCLHSNCKTSGTPRIGLVINTTYNVLQCNSGNNKKYWNIFFIENSFTTVCIVDAYTHPTKSYTRNKCQCIQIFRYLTLFNTKRIDNDSMNLIAYCHMKFGLVCVLSHMKMSFFYTFCFVFDYFFFFRISFSLLNIFSQSDFFLSLFLQVEKQNYVIKWC